MLTLSSGIVSYILLNSSAWLLKYFTHGRIVPYDYEHSDYWTGRPVGGILPGWVKRLCRGKRDFWREYDFDEEEERRERSASRRSDHDSLPTTAGTVSGSSVACGASSDGRTEGRVVEDFAQSWEMPELAVSAKGPARVEERAEERGGEEGVGRFGFVKAPRSPVTAWRQ